MGGGPHAETLRSEDAKRNGTLIDPDDTLIFADRTSSLDYS
jgi:hypothetical protein